jgi:hypothetical protein
MSGITNMNNMFGITNMNNMPGITSMNNNYSLLITKTGKLDLSTDCCMLASRQISDDSMENIC